MKTIDLLYEAIDTYGRIAQITKAIEEMGELTVELSKYLNGDCARYHNIASEIADVQIMCSQLELIFNIEAEVQAQREYKIKRLYKRLQEFELIEKNNKKYKHICDDKSCRLVEVKE